MVPLYRHSRINTRDHDDDAFDGLIVGMALSPSYGTVSVRRSDGSYAAAAKVDGSQSYLETMKRLSDQNACHPTEPYGTIGEGIVDAPRQAMRRARKHLGYPASADVSNIVTLISSLQEEVESQNPGRRIREVTVAVPSVIALYSEDIRDALEFLNIPSQEDKLVYDAPRSLLTAFVAHGCKNENRTKDVLAVEYTKQSLSAEYDTSSGSHTHLSGRVFTTFESGSRRSGEPGHSHALAMDIRGAVKAYNKTTKPKVDVVLVMGEEGVQYKSFHDTLCNVVREFGEPEILSDDSLYAASKGAAQMAWKHVTEAQRNREYSEKSRYED
ncbi:MAG: hypothetical protein M1831_006453 [Alyxoria varia]|nr:MAG: hypothetical protein M1831_006453 [Alyxoria varia]